MTGINRVSTTKEYQKINDEIGPFSLKKTQTLDLTFEIAGESKVQWTRASPTTPYIRNYFQKERILEINIGLNGVNDKAVLHGTYQTNFMFTLPTPLPSTFEGSSGFTKYWAKVEGKSPNWFKKTKIIPFLVTTKVDLNHIPGFLTPYYHQIVKKFLLFGQLSASVKTYTGFAPGQRIPCEVTIINEHEVAISKLKLSLVQLIEYNSTSGYANEEKRLCCTENDKLFGAKQEVCKLDLLVEPCVPSTFNFVHPLIKISYVLKIEMTFPYHRPIIEDIPVSVGSIPVQHFEHNAFM